jgi:hypothetical protein
MPNAAALRLRSQAHRGDREVRHGKLRRDELRRRWNFNVVTAAQSSRGWGRDLQIPTGDACLRRNHAISSLTKY